MKIKNGGSLKSLEFKCHSMELLDIEAGWALCEICGQAWTRAPYYIQIEILRWSLVGHSSSSSSSSSASSSPLISEIEIDCSSIDSE